MINLFSPRLMSWAVFFVIIFCCSVQAQTKTNLEVFKALVDSSISNIFIGRTIISDEILLDINSSPSYRLFENQIYQSIKALNKNIVKPQYAITTTTLNYTLEEVKVSYGEIFIDGLLGDHLVVRKLKLKGSFSLQSDEIKSDNFYYENVDTVFYDEISSLENPAYPFTQGELPSEPFLSNIFEPIVALTTAAVVIVLLFTVRSR